MSDRDNITSSQIYKNSGLKRILQATIKLKVHNFRSLSKNILHLNYLQKELRCLNCKQPCYINSDKQYE
ncbi:hypothetical protein NIES2119_01165 [[Phormidium ambiguum] IAM M-71]|uniref:Uncharacterized protein n=1 Tax=[Phormidium ambiguum] IAM M-71 TaxID=454136 RepID=A0A1U7IU27_9CYAN|nr:hypothetical protein NIES2119_01165 [Phormidium ambiguum IAM M-71]